MNAKKTLVTLISACLGALLAGCGSTATGPTTPRPVSAQPLTTAAVPAPAGSGGFLMEGSSVRSYSSLAELNKDATLVALITPTGTAHVESISGVPFTVATASISRVFKGSASSSLLDVRQLGDATSGGLMVTGQSYVAFLQPFELLHGHPTSQYVVIGGLAGLYWQTSSGMLQRVDAHSVDLPLLLSPSQVEDAVRAS